MRFLPPTGIEKDQIDRTEEIPALIEQFLFNLIFGAARRLQNPSSGLVVERFAEKGHGAIEMVQVQFFGSREPISFPPAFRRPITARCEQPMDHGQIDRALDHSTGNLVQLPHHRACSDGPLFGHDGLFATLSAGSAFVSKTPFFRSRNLLGARIKSHRNGPFGTRHQRQQTITA
mgnify:CR=1 FL=1